MERKKTGILLVNLGTPDNTGYWAIRRYLSEFLSDRRVIEMPFLLWQCILQGIILTVRPHKVGKNYRMIWDQAENRSPLSVITERQAEKLATCFRENDIQLEWAMRYGNPSIKDRITKLVQQGCDHLFILPLYPQYSATTTASVNDAVFRTLLTLRKQPAVQTVFSYADHPLYIEALKKQIESQLANLDEKPERVILSFHGLPRSYVDKGDPYDTECQKTAKALRHAMGKTETEMPLAFQSRFGPSQWLEPNIADLLKEYAATAIRRVAVMAPGFLTDCLETLEEINHQYREVFLAGGGEQFTYIPCLNDGDVAIRMLEGLIRQEIQGGSS